MMIFNGFLEMVMGRVVSRKRTHHAALVESFESRCLLAAGLNPTQLETAGLLSESPKFEENAASFYSSVNLKGSLFSINSSFVYSPGATIPFNWQIINEGSATIGNSFSVNIYLSRDSTIDTSDTFVRAWTFGAGFPAYTYSGVVSDSVTIPFSSDPFWTSSGYYYLGMVIDPFQQVFEYNEFDNSSTSWGGDYAGIYVSVPRPDFISSHLVPSTYNVKTGESISLWGGITNAGDQAFWGDVSVDVYLSRDNVIGSDDIRLTSQSLFVYTPPGLTQNYTLNVTLPDGNSPIWGESGTYYVGVMIDPNNAITESNEFNNANNGLGFDVAPLVVETRIDLTQLPSTNFQPGALLSYYYQQMLAALNTTISDWNGIAKDASGIYDAKGVISALNAMKLDMSNFIAQLDKLVSRKVAVLVLGPGTTLDLAQVEQAERLLVYLLKRYSSSGSVVTARALAASDDGLDSLKVILKQTLTDFSPNRLMQETNDMLGAAGKVIGGAGATVLSKATGLVKAALNMARMGVGSITKGTEFEDTARANGDTVESVLWNDLKTKLNEALNAVNPDAARLKKLVEDAQRVGQTLKEAYSAMKPRIREIYDRARTRWITGSWKGTMSSQGTFGTTTAPITVSFKNWSLGRVQATISSFASVFDASGNLVRKIATSSKVTGGFTTPDKFEGTLTFKNAATGATESRPITWTYDGGSFSGEMGSSMTTMKVNKR